MPTIREVLNAALEALEKRMRGPGTPEYDDLKQAIAQLEDGDGLNDRLTQ